MHLARENGIDVLAEFSVVVKHVGRKEGRERTIKKKEVHNTTELTLIDVRGGRTLFESLAVNNMQVKKARDNPLIDDPVERMFIGLQKYIDENLMPQPMPSSIRPEHARKRVAALAARKVDNPLIQLMEIRLYHQLGLISRVELQEAYQQATNQALGLKLADASEEVRLDAIKTWLPNQSTP